jgi:hypothetical protein
MQGSDNPLQTLPLHRPMDRLEALTRIAGRHTVFDKTLLNLPVRKVKVSLMKANKKQIKISYL